LAPGRLRIKQDLLIVLTPYVIRDATDQRRVRIVASGA
jgi:hypothetical protein